MKKINTIVVRMGCILLMVFLMCTAVACAEFPEHPEGMNVLADSYEQTKPAGDIPQQAETLEQEITDQPTDSEKVIVDENNNGHLFRIFRHLELQQMSALVLILTAVFILLCVLRRSFIIRKRGREVLSKREEETIVP